MMDNLPPLRALQIFDTVGRCGGISEAARRMNISAGAVSQQMKILEQDLGISLTVRHGKRIRLTAEGLRFHESCAAAFESLRAARTEIDLAKNTSNLRVSALPSVMASWLAPLMFSWQQTEPEIDVYLDGSHTEPADHGREIDFRITYGNGSGGHSLPTDNSIELFRDCVVPVCSPLLVGEDKAMPDPSSFSRYPLLSIDWLPKFTSPPSWRDWFTANDIECSGLRDSQRVFSQSSMAIQAALIGQGIVLAQYSMITRELENGQLVLLAPKPLLLEASYFLTWSKTAFDLPHRRKFQRWLLARGREQDRRSAALFQLSQPDH